MKEQFRIWNFKLTTKIMEIFSISYCEFYVWCLFTTFEIFEYFMTFLSILNKCNNWLQMWSYSHHKLKTMICFFCFCVFEMLLISFLRRLLCCQKWLFFKLIIKHLSLSKWWKRIFSKLPFGWDLWIKEIVPSSMWQRVEDASKKLLNLTGNSILWHAKMFVMTKESDNFSCKTKWKISENKRSKRKSKL